ncbi:MAG: hypothetical protein F6K19_07165 [Cyanothece sp. SIO1E1]|nr:hypothetical protein [Cyanothece sp. SIO1E1]
MKGRQTLEDFAAYNERSLKTLSRAIALSRGQFSLILVRCNYVELQTQMRQRLQECCPIQIRDLVLHGSAKTLYSAIHNKLGQECPQALMILGLESVAALDALLTATNQVRDEFRKSFAFPLVLWVNDEVLQKLSKLSPDFNSWAGVPIQFSLPTEALIHLLWQETDTRFAQAMEVGAGRFPRSSALYLETSFYSKSASKAALKDLQHRSQVLGPALTASLQFILGLDAYANHQMEQARQYYQQSLEFWQSAVKQQGLNHTRLPQESTLNTASPMSEAQYLNLCIERQGCVRFYLGLWWRRYAVLHRAEYKSACRQAQDYYQQCIEGLQQSHHAELAAKFIIAWGEVLQQLAEWDRLEIVAQTAVDLYRTYFDPIRLAYSYGLLAEVALARSAWRDAKQYAEQALQTNTQIPDAGQREVAQNQNSELSWARQHYGGLYLLLLAKAQAHLNLDQAAETNLETAKSQCNHAYDPPLYTRILEALRSLYYSRGEYLKAFSTKQEQRSIEQQYSLKAFVGAGRLQPERQVINPALVPYPNEGQSDPSHPQDITVAQEIAASGRQQDVNELIRRLSRNDYKLTVLHGQSGVGKSSLVNAGLMPALRQKPIGARNVLPVVLNVYTDWVRELGKNLAKALAENGIQPPVSEPDIPLNPKSLLDQIRADAEHQSLLVVLVFDQFEEFFFIYSESIKRRPFLKFLADCLNLAFVKVVLSLREDYLHYLLECDRLNLDVITNDILGRDKRYPLGNFSTEDARLIIQRLTNRSQFHLEPALIEQLVKDLSQDLEEVRPIELQVVGVQLQADDITTLKQYKALGANPKAQLVGRFLEKVIEDCGAENKQAAYLVLYLLTDEKGTRPPKTLDELTTNLSALTANFKDEAQLNLILEILVKSGLVLLLPEIPKARYQLVHDYLVGVIRQHQKPALLEQISELQEREAQSQAEIQQLRQEKKLLEALAREADLEAELARQEEQQKRAEEQQKRAEEKQKHAEEELIRAKRQRQIISIFAGIVTVLGIAAHFLARHAAITQVRATISQSSALLLSNDQLEALVAGVKAVRGLQSQNIFPTQLGLKFETASQLLRVIHSIKEQNRLQGHSAWVNQVSFSSDGEIMASASADTTVKLWGQDGKLLHTLQHNNRVNSVSFSSDGQIIAVASDDNTVKLWNRNGKELNTLEGHKNSVNSVSFSSDDQMIASASDDNTIKLWSREGQLRTTLTAHDDRVKAVSFSPDGETLASASWDNTVKLWDREGNLLKTLTHDNKVTTVSFSPDGKIISGNWDSTIKIWSQDGTLLQTLSAHHDRITSVSISPDVNIMTSVSADGVVILWQITNVESKMASFEQLDTLGAKKVISVSFGPGGILASAGADNTIRLWQLSGMEPRTLRQHLSSVTSVSFSPDGKRIASAEDTSISPDGEIENGQVLLWDLESGGTQVLSALGSVSNVKFSPDGQTLAMAENSIDPDKTFSRVTLRSIDGKVLKQLAVKGNIASLSFSPDSKIIAIAENYTLAKSMDEISQISLWQPENEDKNITFHAHDDRITNVSFSPDGNILASASWDNTAKLWDLKGDQIAVFKGHNNQVTTVKFSPNGKTLASASYDNTVKLWSLDGREQKTLKGHISPVSSLDFRHDGSTLVTASTNGTIKLWDWTDTRLLATLTNSSNAINSVSFSPDGETIVSASANQTVRLWNFNLDELLVQGCSWLNNYLVNKSDKKEQGDDLLRCDHPEAQKQISSANHMP